MILLHDLIGLSAQAEPDATAVSHRGISTSYGELWRLVGRIADAFASAGLNPDDRVAIYLDKRLETIAACFGAALAGGVFVPINPVLRDEQVRHIVTDCGATFLVTSGARLEALSATLEDSRELRHLVLVDEPGETERPDLTVATWPESSGNGPEVRHHRRIDSDMAAILYTSGSTGKPKGVVLSHRNLVTGATSVNQYLGNTSDDRILAALPWSFDAGLSQLTTAFGAGATIVLFNYLTARDLVRACAAERVTAITGVPPLYNQLVQMKWPSEATENLRYFANTGGHLAKPTLDKLRAIFPQARPFLMYGLTEAFRSTYLDPTEVDRRPDSIGKAIPNAEILVVGDDGEICGPGEEGELVHRGALVAMGYWNDPERTAERFRPAPGRPRQIPLPEPAVWSGDTVRMDEDGFLYFVGRRDGMIKSSGYRVSPTEVEEVVLALDEVADAVAIGVPDDALGQRIVVVAAPSAGHALDRAAILGHCRARLPLYMVPSEIVEREPLPLTASGKIDRVRLRRELLDGSGSQT